MLKRSSEILVLIDKEEIKKTIFTACKNEEVTLFDRATKDYAGYELIVCEEKHLEEIGWHPGIILLLLSTTKIKKYIGKINKFIRPGVSYEEFSTILYTYVPSVEIKDLGGGENKLVPSGVKEINYGDLYINFEQELYVYKGKEIYLTKREREYVIKFLFTEENLSKDRVILHRARKKFGKDFLTKKKGEENEERDEFDNSEDDEESIDFEESIDYEEEGTASEDGGDDSENEEGEIIEESIDEEDFDEEDFDEEDQW